MACTTARIDLQGWFDLSLPGCSATGVAKVTCYGPTKLC